jgi:hypothetical protein
MDQLTTRSRIRQFQETDVNRTTAEQILAIEDPGREKPWINCDVFAADLIWEDRGPNLYHAPIGPYGR